VSNHGPYSDWRGARSTLEITPSRVSGYRRSHEGERQRSIHSLCHARSGSDWEYGLSLSTVSSTSPLQAVSMLRQNKSWGLAGRRPQVKQNNFHGISRAKGPNLLG